MGIPWEAVNRRNKKKNNKFHYFIYFTLKIKVDRVT